MASSVAFERILPFANRQDRVVPVNSRSRVRCTAKFSSPRDQ
jgi:hypothetical protein